MRPTPFCDDIARPVERFNPGVKVMDLNASKALERDLLDSIHDNMRLRWELEMTTLSAQAWKKTAETWIKVGMIAGLFAVCTLIALVLILWK